MLDYVEIEGFKTLKKVNLKLEPLNILIGGNGSGKSNLLSFFTFLDVLYHQSMQRYIVARGGVEAFLHKGAKVSHKIRFLLEFDGGKNGYGIELEKGVDGIFVTDEDLIYKGKHWKVGGTYSEARVREHTIGRGLYIRKYIQSCRRYHFHDIGLNSPMKGGSNVDDDTLYLYSDGSNLAAFLYHIREKHPNRYNVIRGTIHSVAPFFNDFVLEPDRDAGTVRLQWRSEEFEAIQGPNAFSDGTLRFIALTVLFLQPKLPTTIVIDEPELGLHPFAIAKLAGLMRSATARGAQVIAATQSADLISHFNPEDVIAVDLVDGESRFQRLSSNNLDIWLEMYSLGEIWKRSIIPQGQLQY